VKSSKVFHSVMTAGLFASLIFLVNCDNTSTRSIRALMPANKLDSSHLPPCTESIMTLIDARKKILEDLNKKYNEYKSLDLDQTKKDELNEMVDNLKNKSNEVYAAIGAVKGGPQGCNSVSSDNKKLTFSIEAMKLENRNIAKKVAELTGATNALALSSEELNATTLIENQAYKMKSELARVMMAAKVGNMYLMDGKVFDEAGAADDLKTLKEKKDKSFCFLDASIGEITSAELVRVIQIHQDPNADQKSTDANVRWVANGDQLNSFSCIVNKTTDVPTELRKIFGDLITLKNGVGSSGDVNTGHH